MDQLQTFVSEDAKSFEKKETQAKDEAKSTGKVSLIAEHSFSSCPTDHSSLQAVGLEKMGQMSLDEDGESKEEGKSSPEEMERITVYDDEGTLWEHESMTTEERKFFRLLRSSPLETQRAYGDIY